jgi:hypothetical protein
MPSANKHEHDPCAPPSTTHCVGGVWNGQGNTYLLRFGIYHHLFSAVWPKVATTIAPSMCSHLQQMVPWLLNHLPRTRTKGRGKLLSRWEEQFRALAGCYNDLLSIAVLGSECQIGTTSCKVSTSDWLHQAHLPSAKGSASAAVPGLCTQSNPPK